MDEIFEETPMWKTRNAGRFKRKGMSSSSGSSPDLSDTKIVSRTRRGSKRLKDEGILDKVKQSYWANMTKVMTHDIGVHGKIDLMVGRNASAKEIREYVQEIVQDDASKHNSTDEEVPDDSSDRFLDNLSDLLRRQEEESAEKNVTIVEQVVDVEKNVETNDGDEAAKVVKSPGNENEN